MKIEFTEKEIDFLIESLNYAKESFHKSISKYPPKEKELHQKEIFPQKEKMFQELVIRIREAKKIAKNEVHT